MKLLIKVSVIIITTLFIIPIRAATIDPLPSWTDGEIKTKIINFVETTTNQHSPNYVTPADRIATFDNDGTLWIEKPIYTQYIFLFQRLKTLAAQHPELKKDPAITPLLNLDIKNIDQKSIDKLIELTSSNMSIDEYKKIVRQWLAITKNPRYNRLYTDLVYQPMLEMMHYLKKNNFKVYIVSGSSHDFIRAYSPDTYDIPVEFVIGTTHKTIYDKQNYNPQLIKSPELLWMNDKSGKVQGIDLVIGKKPIIAFGNSNGDREMLEWTQSNPAKHMMLIVHHDDAEREYAYDSNSDVGNLSIATMQEAKKNHWLMISMKNDWKYIFPFEKYAAIQQQNKHSLEHSE